MSKARPNCKGNLERNDGYKYCNGCKETLSVTKFNFRKKDGKIRPYPRCRPCHKIYSDDYDFRRRIEGGGAGGRLQRDLRQGDGRFAHLKGWVK